MLRAYFGFDTGVLALSGPGTKHHTAGVRIPVFLKYSLVDLGIFLVRDDGRVFLSFFCRG